MRITDEQLAALKVAHPRARKYTLDVMGDVFDVVLRPASRQEWKAFRALRANSDEAKSQAANEQLITFCALYPDPKTAELAALFDRYPGASDTLWSYVAQMAGMTAKVEVGD